jgi:Phage integrase family
VRRAKITNLRFHDLRHTFASWLAQKGRPLKEIQEALGHKSLAMTMRYAHLSPDNLRAAVASLDGILPSAPWPDGARLAQETHASRNQPRPDRRSCSYFACLVGGPSGTRTPDPLIKSQLLCQLS